MRLEAPAPSPAGHLADDAKRQERRDGGISRLRGDTKGLARGRHSLHRSARKNTSRRRRAAASVRMWAVRSCQPWRMRRTACAVARMKRRPGETPVPLPGVI